MKTITTAQYYTRIMQNDPTQKKLADTIARQLQVIGMMSGVVACDEFKERTIKQAKNIIEACRLIEKKLFKGRDTK